MKVLLKILTMAQFNLLYNLTKITPKVTKLSRTSCVGRGVESWWGCSDSGSYSDSGLLIDSGSDSRSDTKYKINYT